MKVSNINSINNKLHFGESENSPNKQRSKNADIAIDTITTAISFTAYKNIDKFTPVTELFKKGLGKKTRAVAIGASILTGAVINPALSFAYKLACPNEKYSLLKDTLHGALNGLTAPLLGFSSLLWTVPTALGINNTARYLFSDNDKNIKDFLYTQKDTIGTTALIGIPILTFIGKKGKMSLNSWETACQKAKENTEKLRAFRNPYERTLDLEKITATLDKKTQEEIGQKLLPIFFNPSENKIIDTNIFIAKWLQTIPDKRIDEIDNIQGIPISDKLKQIIKNLKGACPASYTPVEAQNLINKTFGNKYIITQNEPLGVGTIAETYLAKNNETGQEVVIKLLKKGISKEKIETDRTQALELLEKSPLRKKPEEYEYYKKYLNVMYDAWARETILSLEKDAAELMAKNAKKFNVVKPIEIKDNIYVMEKANGVQLNKLGEELKRRGTTLTEAQIKKLLLNYNEVFIEQLISIPRDGKKIVQADPNSANIFIDLDNLEKPITFLDLGNVLTYTNTTATRNALGHLDYIFGNSRGIAKTNLDGAILPEGLTKEEALEKLTEKLNIHIFNNETLIPPPNTINDFCTSVMREMKIIPNADNANLIKAETTYAANIFELRHNIQSNIQSELTHGGNFNSKLKAMLKEMKDSGDFKTLVRCILKEIFTSVKNAKFRTQKLAYQELKEKIAYIENNKEQALTTFYGLIT